ncbi:hypothetical protein HanPSC8_Chr08g0328951 [Helianthus annuus]|nr:hypothetical protein HanPSC8_Chr08g0328951 [Helianthus annuus]
MKKAGDKTSLSLFLQAQMDEEGWRKNVVVSLPAGQKFTGAPNLLSLSSSSFSFFHFVTLCIYSTSSQGSKRPKTTVLYLTLSLRYVSNSPIFA